MSLSHFSITFSSFRKIAQAAGGVQGQGEFLCQGVVRCCFVMWFDVVVLLLLLLLLLLFLSCNYYHFYFFTSISSFVAHIYPPQPPQPLPSIDLEEWRGEAAVACTVVTVSIHKAPHNVRHRFAKGLIALGKKSGRQYSGFVKRESATIVTAQIVTTNTASAHDLGALWGFLRSSWPTVDKAAILYKNNDFECVASLSDHFMVLHPNGEPDNWFNQAEDFDDGASDYSVVSSIN